MRALLQRVTGASVTIDGETAGAIGPGLVILVGISRDDTEAEVAHVVDKAVNLRIFSDDDGKFQHSALDIGADLLVVSQFTLYGDTRKGRRPSFTKAAVPADAEVPLRANPGAVPGDRAEGRDGPLPGIHGRGPSQRRPRHHHARHRRPRPAETKLAHRWPAGRSSTDWVSTTPTP